MTTYESENVKLYLGDCLDILPTLAAGSIDAVVTDPPYGANVPYASYVDTEENWYRLMVALVPEVKRIARFVVMPSGQIMRLKWWYDNFPPDWLIAWYKGSPGHVSKIGFNDWEPHVTWGRPVVPMHDYFHTRCGFTIDGHPCPKPIDWAMWLVSRAAPEGGTILDPFMGSGTTGVACIQTGRKFIGIEMDPGYFELAKRRILDSDNKVTIDRVLPSTPQQEEKAKQICLF